MRYPGSASPLHLMMMMTMTMMIMTLMMMMRTGITRTTWSWPWWKTHRWWLFFCPIKLLSKTLCRKLALGFLNMELLLNKRETHCIYEFIRCQEWVVVNFIVMFAFDRWGELEEIFKIWSKSMILSRATRWKRICILMHIGTLRIYQNLLYITI